MPNTPFLVSIFSPTSDGVGLRCSGGTSAALMSLAPRAGTHRADSMRHLPDAVLVGDQNLAVAPGEPVGPVQALDVAIDPVGLAVAVVVAQQRDVADLLLGHEHVAVRQHQQTARVLEPGGEGGGGEALGHARRLAGVGQRQRAARHDRAGLRRRQVFGLDGDAAADLLVGQRRRIVGRGLGLRRAVLRQRRDGGRAVRANAALAISRWNDRSFIALSRSALL